MTKFGGERNATLENLDFLKNGYIVTDTGFWVGMLVASLSISSGDPGLGRFTRFEQNGRWPFSRQVAVWLQKLCSNGDYAASGLLWYNTRAASYTDD